ncbi:MAG: hypothetical protein JSR97_00765 [Verrucomicrobia bacterium]|nr:hypothetical protein [Verrucomicrobiota bacterium]
MMEITNITELQSLRRVAATQRQPRVDCQISAEAYKIEGWVEMLKNMPDVTRTPSSVNPDPAKIAEAMLSSSI